MSNLGAVLVVLWKDLLRKIRSPLAPVVMLLFPVVFSLLIGLTFASERMAPIKIALVDDDGGLVSRLIRSSLTQDRIPLRFDVQVADSAAAMELIENSRVSAVLRIPPGFSDSLLSIRTARLQVVKNPAEAIYPQIAEQFVGVLGQLGSAVVQILGEPIGEIRDAIGAEGRPSERFVSDVSLMINRKMDGIGRYAIPPRITLEKAGPATEEKRFDGSSPFHIATFVLPGMAVFSLLMLALVSMSDFQREGARGTLARQFVAPVPFGAVILGKIGATWALSMVCILILALLAVFWANASVPLIGFLVLSGLFALAATGFAAFIQSLSRSERTGSAIGSIIVMVMSMVGGSWVPLDALPAFTRRIAPFTLNYWGTEGYKDLVFRSASLADLLPNLAVLLLIGGLLSIVAIARFRRRYGRGI